MGDSLPSINIEQLSNAVHSIVGGIGMGGVGQPGSGGKTTVPQPSQPVATPIVVKQSPVPLAPVPAIQPLSVQPIQQAFTLPGSSVRCIPVGSGASNMPVFLPINTGTRPATVLTMAGNPTVLPRPANTGILLPVKGVLPAGKPRAPNQPITVIQVAQPQQSAPVVNILNNTTQSSQPSVIVTMKSPAKANTATTQPLTLTLPAAPLLSQGSLGHGQILQGQGHILQGQGHALYQSPVGSQTVSQSTNLAVTQSPTLPHITQILPGMASHQGTSMTSPVTSTDALTKWPSSTSSLHVSSLLDHADHLEAGDSLSFVPHSDLDIQHVFQTTDGATGNKEDQDPTSLNELDHLLQPVTSHLMNNHQEQEPVKEGQPPDPSLTAEPTIYCVECNESYPSAVGCAIHNTLYMHIEDSPILSRARMTCPEQLCLKTTGKGDVRDMTSAWSKQVIPKGSKFGPLQGMDCIPDSDKQDHRMDNVYIWQVMKDFQCVRTLDCSDEELSNWMMFVKRAVHSAEQNVVAYQEDNQVYMVTSKNIDAGRQLLYWYSKEFAEQLGEGIKPEECSQCSVCNKRFGTHLMLAQHMRYQHPDMSQRKWKCQFCPKAFSSSTKLNTHVLSHLGQKPHQCSVCNKGFTDQSNLKIHMSVHTGEKKFKCSICNRAFRLKAHLKTHMLTHSGEKRLPCRFCEKSFARSSDLKVHELQHTKETRIKCTFEKCSKVFYKMQNFRKHLRVHEGIKNHTCTLCQRSFASKYHLKRHSWTCRGPKTKPQKTDGRNKSAKVKEMSNGKSEDDKHGEEAVQ